MGHLQIERWPAGSRYRCSALLALLTPDEIEDALRFVEICERGGGTSAEETDEWRRRILGWQAFLEIGLHHRYSRRAA